MRFTPLLLLTALVAGACGPSGHPSAGPSALPTVTSLKVVSEPARRETLKASLKLTGQVTPTEEKRVKITAPLDGVLSHPLVKVGEVVHQSDPLAEENSVYGLTSMQVLEKLEASQNALVQARSQLSQAQTNLTQAEANMGQARFQVSNVTSDLRQADAELRVARIDLDRKKDLAQAGAGPQADADDAQARWEKARAAQAAEAQNVKVAREQLPLAQRNVAEARRAAALARQGVDIASANYERSRAVLSQASLVGSSLPSGLTSGADDAGAARAVSSFYVRSPITGVVTDLQLSAGLKVQAGSELGTVVDISTVYVDANAFEKDVAQLHVGDLLKVTSPSAPGKTFNGRIRYVGKKVNPDTRTIQVRSQISNPGGLLRPDTFVDVSIDLPARVNALVVPEKAVLSLDNQDWVLVEKKPDEYAKQAVLVGIRSGGKAEILKGLKPGERVVTEGNLLLEAREH